MEQGRGSLRFLRVPVFYNETVMPCIKPLHISFAVQHFLISTWYKKQIQYGELFWLGCVNYLRRSRYYFSNISRISFKQWREVILKSLVREFYRDLLLSLYEMKTKTENFICPKSFTLITLKFLPLKHKSVLTK